jgi:hypothetical protein
LYEQRHDRCSVQTRTWPQLGEPVPWFNAPVLNGNANYSFHITTGRPVLMLFLGSTADPAARAALDAALAQSNLFDDRQCCFFGVTVDPADETEGRIAPRLPGIRYFIDYNRSVSAAFCSIDPAAPSHFRPQWLVLDRQLRMVGHYRLEDFDRAMTSLRRQIAGAEADSWAPVLEVQNVLESSLCDHLVEL